MIFSFISVFGLIFISVTYFMKGRGEENRTLAAVVSVSIAGLSTLFLANNPVALEWISHFYILFTFLGPLLLMIAGFTTIKKKWVKVTIVVIIMLSVAYLIFFSGLFDFGESVTIEEEGWKVANQVIVAVAYLIIGIIFIFGLFFVVRAVAGGGGGGTYTTSGGGRRGGPTQHPTVTPTVQPTTQQPITQPTQPTVTPRGGQPSTPAGAPHGRCPHCNQPLSSPTANFCGSCGRSISVAPRPSVSSVSSTADDLSSSAIDATRILGGLN